MCEGFIFHLFLTDTMSTQVVDSIFKDWNHSLGPVKREYQ